MYKRIFYCIIVIFICLLGYFVMNAFIEESRTPYSKYDETFVIKDKAIFFQADNIEEVQHKISSYAKDWSKLEGCISITVFFDQKLDITRVEYNFKIPKINEYFGRLNVLCDKQENGWKLWEARSYYTKIHNLKVYTSSQEDELLQEKIDKSIDYIKSKSQPVLDMYAVSIDGQEISIDAHNISKNTEMGRWSAVIKFNDIIQ